MTWQTIPRIQNTTDTGSLNSTTKFKIFTCKHLCVYIFYIYISLSLWEGENSWDLAQIFWGKNCRSKDRVHKWKSSAVCLYYQRGFLPSISSGKYQTVVQPPHQSQIVPETCSRVHSQSKSCAKSDFHIMKIVIVLCNHINSVSIAYNNSSPHLHIVQL